MKDWLSFDVWASSDICLELGDRTRWFFVHENHGYAGGRVDKIARRFPPERPEQRPVVDVATQMFLGEVA